MTRTMYDSVTPSAVPADAQMVAGYIDGHYRSFDGLVARFPNAVHVPIAVFASTNGGVVLDCETGDATPAQAPGWIKMRRAAGVVRPTVYTLASWAGAVQQACSAAGLVQHRDYELWLASYDGRPSPTGHGEAAKQYRDTGPHGENADMTVVFDDAWPYYAATPPPPSFHPSGGQEDSTMALVTGPSGSRVDLVVVGLPDPAADPPYPPGSGPVYHAFADSVVDLRAVKQWETLGGYAHAVSAGWTADGKTFVVSALGVDGHVWLKTWDGAHQWSPWQLQVSGNVLVPAAVPG